ILGFDKEDPNIKGLSTAIGLTMTTDALLTAVMAEGVGVDAALSGLITDPGILGLDGSLSALVLDPRILGFAAKTQTQVDG
ncbi:hypothetical protein M3M33_16790, partial [Loigolactobacillus coryniformis]|uniref:hypothetical protein n=1 Tax=Loigolactobacillus coryniformis TaxID=1610 RepID=UPI00201B18C9